MGVAVGVDLLAMAMVAGRQRVEVDAGRLDGRLGLGAIALRVVARERPPGLHPCPAATVRRARYDSTHRV
jgi:hypothetical protein